MRTETKSTTEWMLLGALGIAIVVFSLCPSRAEAQKGDNAVYNSSSNCCTSSPAFIDASPFATQNGNICSVLNFVLSPGNGIVPATGAVIDARGLPFSRPATSMTCTTANPSPWAGITSPPPSTILLPATGSTPIQIPSTWVLPNYTVLIGEGDNVSSGTTIQAKTTFTSGTDMIDLGSSILCPLQGGIHICNSVAVRNLVLDGQGQLINVNGIVNTNAQTGSYVDHVTLYQIIGTGLSVSGQANDSGPHTNIAYDLGTASGVSSTHCASINALTGTRGIHGLTCLAENNDPPAAVLLDSSNNSIEDVNVMGFYDGILVGANAPAKSNVLVNIIGDTTIPGGLTPVNTVHISSNFTVTDLSITGLSNSGVSGTYSLEDDASGPHLSDSTVGIYALGEKDSATGAYSRFTTSPNAATWAVGSTAPGSGTCARGSLYSCTGGATSCSNNALWDCVPSGSSTMWTSVK